MRRLALLFAILAAVAAPASAQDSGGRINGPAPTTTLRGAAGEPAPAGDANLAALVPAPLPVAPAGSSPIGGEARQCRVSCAKDYYFCLAADEDQCPQTWTKCTARCGY